MQNFCIYHVTSSNGKGNMRESGVTCVWRVTLTGDGEGQQGLVCWKKERHYSRKLPSEHTGREGEW